MEYPLRNTRADLSAIALEYACCRQLLTARFLSASPLAQSATVSAATPSAPSEPIGAYTERSSPGNSLLSTLR